MHEEDLGYQHDPILTLNDLLIVQSPQFSMDLFRTSLNVKVMYKEDTIEYQFESVADVNLFLYNSCFSRDQISDIKDIDVNNV